MNGWLHERGYWFGSPETREVMLGEHYPYRCGWARLGWDGYWRENDPEGTPSAEWRRERRFAD